MEKHQALGRFVKLYAGSNNDVCFDWHTVVITCTESAAHIAAHMEVQFNTQPNIALGHSLGNSAGYYTYDKSTKSYTYHSRQNLGTIGDLHSISRKHAEDEMHRIAASGVDILDLQVLEDLGFERREL